MPNSELVDARGRVDGEESRVQTTTQEHQAWCGRLGSPRGAGLASALVHRSLSED